ncbi:hypothetical protein GOP47_0022139 [Adiantum capillus-veneris]|uniref:Pentatricopeptide repeat-containing protein n=1 Tax=Adiantum capillus-veneris TaxID=13818 RepID=A0A9D4Z7K0_ADICA|nr:hypothetical protein GOP47_0022139 [Adiantum capillus-veneris]
MQATLRVSHSLNAMVEASASVENYYAKLKTIDNGASAIEHVPSVESFSAMLRDCRNKKNIQLAKTAHDLICLNGLEGHHSLENFLVSMFVDCEGFCIAQQVFKKLLHPNEYSWSSLMQAYIGSRDFESALLAYQVLQVESITPNEPIYIAALKACVRLARVKTGQQLHFEISKEGFEKDLYVGSTLVDLYCKCGFLEEAHAVLLELPTRDVVLWTTLIAGYTKQGLGKEALKCLKEMKLDGVSPDNFAFVCGLKACSSIGALDSGRQLHAELKEMGRIKDHVVASAVVDFYAKCGSLVEVREVFDEMQVRDVVTWTTLIRGYTEQGLGEEALACFEQMQIDGVLPDAISLVCSLKACGYAGASEIGRELNNVIYKCGYEGEAFVGNMLVDMYVNCKLLSEAYLVFEKLEKKDAITWNTLLAGYAELELGDEALGCLEKMASERTPPDEVTFLYILKTYASAVSRDLGQLVHTDLVKYRGRCQYVHTEIAKYGYEKDDLLQNALVALYIRCGLLEEAWKVFDGFPAKDVISWNVLIEGFTELGLAEEALSFLEQMHAEGVLPDAVTYLCSIRACGILGAFDTGRSLHAEISEREIESATLSSSSKRVIYVKSGIESEMILATALIHMYGRCGSMGDAVLVFNANFRKDLVIWNALLTAFALQGDSYQVFLLFQKMMVNGQKPNAVTFLAMLTVCSHAGLVEKSCDYIECMSKKYCITPTMKHFTCLVDVLGRSGRLEEAAVVLAEMRMQPDLVLWSSMLGACGKWSNREIGNHAFEGAVSLDESHSVAFTSLSNIYMDRAEDDYG